MTTTTDDPGRLPFPLDRRASYGFWSDDKLRFGDLDPLGHVNNAAYATFSESGRVAFVEALGSERLMRRRLDTMRFYSQLLAAQASELYGASDEDDAIGDVAASLLVGGMAELLITWLDGNIDVSREQLIDDFTELFIATGESAVAIAKRRARERRSGGADAGTR